LVPPIDDHDSPAVPAALNPRDPAITAGVCAKVRSWVCDTPSDRRA
jgi:hypothetical protein